MKQHKVKKPKVVELEPNEIEAALAEVKTRLDDKTYRTLKTVVDAYLYLVRMIADKKLKLARLRKLLFGPKTEKRRKVLAQADNGAGTAVAGQGQGEPAIAGPKGTPEKARRGKGHGRNGADAYGGAERIWVPHEKLKPGDACLICPSGKVYALSHPGVIVRVRGQAPLQATIWELEKLRCNACGAVFTAKAPPEVGKEKYDESAISLIGLLKYGTGLPFYRLQRLQQQLALPLPAATQWELVMMGAGKLAPVFVALIREGAAGEILHNDDTPMPILELMPGEKPKKQAGWHMELKEAFSHGGHPPDAADRTGMVTTGIVAINGGRKIALFMTGRAHAGENLKAVLQQRAAELGPPIQMCDGLDRNLPGELKTLLANCLTHARRKIVDVVSAFPEECQTVLDALKDVYVADAEARHEKLSAQERLAFHQQKSAPIMEKLQKWLDAQIEEKRIEPNSGLGEAIEYMRKRWDKLTLFLRVPGAPLDNSIVEQALKRAILHRKNALFYKTQNGARVGDIYMTLIYTAELAGENPLDYLTALLKYANHVAAAPDDWLPWTYRKTQAGLDSS